MQQVIMMPARHTEYSHVSQMRFDSDISIRPVYPTLRNLLCKLRQALPNADHYLVVNRHLLMWQKNDFWTMDVLEFERAVNTSKQAESMENQAMLRRALEKAMELYRGDLLPGCYDEWIVQERERFSQMYLEVLEKLLCLQEKEGDVPGAIRIAQRLLREDPLQEESYRHLMRLYAASGNRAAAVRVYQKCVAALKRELAVEPGPETCRVYEQLTHSEHLRPFTLLQNSGSGLVTFGTAHSKQYSLCECS
jgi:DNA-binding SARP family transcriptional activator